MPLISIITNQQSPKVVDPGFTKILFETHQTLFLCLHTKEKKWSGHKIITTVWQFKLPKGAHYQPNNSPSWMVHSRDVGGTP